MSLIKFLKKNSTKEFIKYCLVGIVNTLVGISTAFICLNQLLLSYSFSTAAAYITGSIVSFIMNKTFTFKSNGNTIWQFIKFFGTMLPAYIISYWLGWKIGLFIVNWDILKPLFDLFIKFTNVDYSLLGENLGILISMAIYLVVGFSINKFLVFTKKK